ncbi:MAG: SMP-30/gluconolactonase/LRE family protein [Paracoccaceae bacterium]
MTTVEVFDTTACALGEGPMWHPLRHELIWFDIIGKVMFAKGQGALRRYAFDGHVSAAGWVDEAHILVASDRALLLFNLDTGAQREVCPLEADNPATRSNDGRADPQGGFWIGTMGLNAKSGAGAIYRYYKGALRKLFGTITIPNAIAFTPDHRHATFTDTARGQVMRVALHPETGWPLGAPEVFIDFSGTGLNPDGAVFDAEGCFWNAQWGASRLARYDNAGNLLQTIDLPTAHITCPAFGGKHIYATSARQGLEAEALGAQPSAGMTFRIAMPPGIGQDEHRVELEI